MENKRMMKKIGCVAFSLLLIQCVGAQTWSEWFRQKKTKIKYLIEQIAALKTYGDVAWKGYGFAKEGLTNIGDIKHDDLTIHGNYFASLRSVNPAIKNYVKVGRIVALQVAILKLYQKQMKLAQRGLTAGDIAYVENVLVNFLAACADIVDELLILTTDNASEMKDDERVRRIDALYVDMRDKYSFLQSFDGETAVLSLQRRKDENDIKKARTLFGVH